MAGIRPKWRRRTRRSNGSGRSKEATVTFRNPKRDATFILQMDNPAQRPVRRREVELRIGDQSLGTVPVGR